MEENKELLALLKKIEESNRKQLWYTRVQCIAALIAVACFAGIYFLIKDFLPQISAIITEIPGVVAQMGVVLENLEIVTTELTAVDFSGMIDVTIGSAQLFGITLPENFRQPFLSEDAGEFWRRWHITLGVWLKTYVYYPIVTSKRVLRLMKSAKKKHGKYAAQLLVSFLALTPVWLFNGVWHGPHLNYPNFLKKYRLVGLSAYFQC